MKWNKTSYISQPSKCENIVLFRKQIDKSQSSSADIKANSLGNKLHWEYCDLIECLQTFRSSFIFCIAVSHCLPIRDVFFVGRFINQENVWFIWLHLNGCEVNLNSIHFFFWLVLIKRLWLLISFNNDITSRKCLNK